MSGKDKLIFYNPYIFLALVGSRVIMGDPTNVGAGFYILRPQVGLTS